MGIPVLILGESGSGKSTSLRNFNPEEVAIFNVAGKPLPFKKKMPYVINDANYTIIEKKLKENKFKKYVIDDAQYLMAFELFEKAKQTGYGKFTDIAVHYQNLLTTIIKETPEDCIVYILSHLEETNSGKLKMKTVGQMLDNQLTVEGLFTIVLMSFYSNKQYKFMTQTDGRTPCKSPLDMFESLEIDNDLKFVDEKIREFYGFDKGEK